jgi:hypothetical protein
VEDDEAQPLDEKERIMGLTRGSAVKSFLRKEGVTENVPKI